MLKKVLTACIDSPKFLVCRETNFYEIYFTFFIFLNHGPLSSITLETRSSIALSTVLSNHVVFISNLFYFFYQLLLYVIFLRKNSN